MKEKKRVMNIKLINEQQRTTTKPKIAKNTKQKNKKKKNIAQWVLN